MAIHGIGKANHRTEGLRAEHLMSAEARRDRPDRGSRRRSGTDPRRNGAALMATVVRMPEVLANTSQAVIQTWLVSVGQQIAVGDPVAAPGYSDVPLTGMRKAIARRLTESKTTIRIST
jgi:hypothetical protein